MKTPDKELLNVKLTTEQRDFLWGRLHEEFEVKVRSAAEELKQIFTATMTKHITTLPNYKTAMKYEKSIRTMAELRFPECIMNSVYDLVITEERKRHPDWSIPSRYVVRSRFLYSYGIKATLEQKIPRLSVLVDLDTKFTEIIPELEVQVILQRTKDLVSLIIEEENLYHEYYSDAGNKFGKLSTWEDLYNINCDWFDIVHDSFIDSPVVKENIERYREDQLIKKGKSIILSDALSELRDIAKKCNLI